VSQLIPSILIVEDDDSTRETIGRILRDGGFAICCEATAHAALSRMARKRFDLVVADINLSGEMNGLCMMRKARQHRPNLRCLFTSGAYQPVVCDPQMDEFIAKPFRPGELVGCVWKVLAGNWPNPRVSIARPD
jgi:DNA-binding response OmpR family regulator